MENDIADVIKKTDQERLVIAELCVQRRNVFRFCRDSEDDEPGSPGVRERIVNTRKATPRSTGIM